MGKTSLVKRLKFGTFDKHEKKTEGINIEEWGVTQNGRTIRLNVWDFGGQEIMHATHQFFLTKRSLYLLVLDARLGEEENRIEYWLEIIESFGGDSPVIIVGNQIDQQPLDIDHRGLQAAYKNIKAIVETSCETGQGISELKEVITREIAALELIHYELLNTWFAVKNRLEEMKKQDFIKHDDYVHLCEEENVTDKTSQHTLIGFLHDLGIVLNYHGDPRLDVTDILNPKWVTDGIYKILNTNVLMTEHKGVLDRDMLDWILDSRKYPKDKHIFLVDMMQKFELCFSLEDSGKGKYLIPGLLPKDASYHGEWGDALVFEYYYNVLHSSIISRAIVRLGQHIHRKTYWRSGVVLAYQKCKALIESHAKEKRISISITGPHHTRQTFLAIIRSHFDHIHQTISKIEAEERVALPDHPDARPVSYNHLLDLEKAGIKSYPPEGLIVEVNVKKLLDLYEPEQQRHERFERHLGEKRPGPEPTPLPSNISGAITPLGFLPLAIRAVPSVKWALGIGGVVAVVAIIAGWITDLRVAGFGAIVMIILMPLLVIFARITEPGGASLRLPARIMTWFVLILFMAVSICLFLSVFFEWPIDLQHWLRESP